MMSLVCSIHGAAVTLFAALLAVGTSFLIVCGFPACCQVNLLTSTEVTSCAFVKDGWTPTSILQTIGNAQPPFHALIDTGALITGLSNYEVRPPKANLRTSSESVKATAGLLPLGSIKRASNWNRLLLSGKKNPC